MQFYGNVSNEHVMVNCYILPTGWLLKPDSRPTFENLILRFQEMLPDPSRYVLTLGKEVSNLI